jgi:hypothetical protein
MPRPLRDKADAYHDRKWEVVETRRSDSQAVLALERLFWRRLGPTMPAAWYGADGRSLSEQIFFFFFFF